MNSFNEIEINGKKINLNELSDEEINKLREYLKEERAIIVLFYPVFRPL